MRANTGDGWALGEAYDAYMGRWSRLVAREFIDWLSLAPAARWLEVGCGTGALTSTICARGGPAAVTACDPSTSFIDHARAKLTDVRATFVAATVEQLPPEDRPFDVSVSGLVLNFIPDPSAALKAMSERVRPGGLVAAYVWDYVGGVEFLTHFWEQAAELDPNAVALDEARRFAAWNPSYLESLCQAVGLEPIDAAVLSIPTAFGSYDDFWRPFLGGAGPGPSYVASLSPSQRESLSERLRARLPARADGSIQLVARALAVRGVRGQHVRSRHPAAGYEPIDCE